MRRALLVVFVVFLFVFFIDLTTHQNVHGNSGGSPNGYTGSPLEFSGRTCGSNGGCHGGGSTFQTNMITTTIPASGYVPGQTYQITATVISAGRTKFGFQLSPQRANGNTAGTMIGNASIQLTGSQRYATHTSASNTGAGSRSWTFNWTAPTAGSGTVTFYASFNAANNNSSTSGDLIFNTLLAVNESVLDIEIQGEPEICSGESVVLSSTYPTGNQWFLNGIPINGATGQTLEATTGGIYSVNNGSQSAQVTIVQLSSPSQPNITSSNTQNLICNGGSITLSTSSQDVLEWSNGAIEPSITITQPGNYFVTASNQCGSTTSQSIQVSTASTPPVPTVVVSGPTIFCAGSASTILTASSGSNAITWQPGNFNGSSIAPIASGNYIATATNGCGSASSTPVAINVEQVLNIPTVLANGPSTFCEGGSIVLSVSPSVNTIWSPGNQSGAQLVVNQTGNYIATNTNSCGSIQSQPFAVTVTNEPVAPQIIGDFILENYCSGDSVFMTVNIATGDSVVWSPFFSNSQDFIATQTGTYTVQVFNSCGSSVSEAVQLVFLPLPETPVLVFENDTLFAIGSNADQYIWLFNGNAVFGASDNFLVPTQSGIYAVNAVNAQGSPCFSGWSNEVNVLLNSLPSTDKNWLKIFPNPTNGILNLINHSSTRISSVKVVDITGRNSRSFSVFNDSVDVSELLPGVYQLHINLNEKNVVVSFVKF